VPRHLLAAVLLDEPRFEIPGATWEIMSLLLAERLEALGQGSAFVGAEGAAEAGLLGR